MFLQENTFNITKTVHPMCVTSQDLSGSFVDVCGILLQKKINSEEKGTYLNSNFVYTSTSRRNMSTLAFAVSQRRPVLMEGITGSGKTAQIAELASRTGNYDIIKIHLGDQTDAKVLLGSYICTEIPG